jgi:ribose 5-phosphate isomerase B
MADSIVMASDHRGTRLKAELRTRLEAQGHAVMDKGADGAESVDYPDFGAPAARAVSNGEAPRGIVICGSGLGMTYTANRFPGVRAAWVQDEEMARLARQHNDANMRATRGGSRRSTRSRTLPAALRWPRRIRRSRPSSSAKRTGRHSAWN